MGKLIIDGIEVGGSSSASSVKYDNTNSTLVSTNVQGAITELNESLNERVSEIETLNTNLTASDNTLFRFGVNESGEYGYIITDSEGADTVVPFSQASLSGFSSLSLSTKYKATKAGIHAAFANIVYPRNYGLPSWSTTGTIIKSTSGTAENHYGTIICLVELEVGDTIMAVNPYPNSTYGGLTVFYP